MSDSVFNSCMHFAHTLKVACFVHENVISLKTATELTAAPALARVRTACTYRLNNVRVCG